jgi:hypothetical protein
MTRVGLVKRLTKLVVAMSMAAMVVGSAQAGSQWVARGHAVPAPGRYGGGPRNGPGGQFAVGVYVAKIGGKQRVSIAAWISPKKLICQPGPWTANTGSPFNQKFFGLVVAANGSFKGLTSVFGVVNNVSGRLTASRVNATFLVKVVEEGHTCTGAVHFDVPLKPQPGLGHTPIG